MTSRLEKFAVWIFVSWAVASGFLQKNDAASWDEWEAGGGIGGGGSSSKTIPGSAIGYVEGEGDARKEMSTALRSGGTSSKLVHVTDMTFRGGGKAEPATMEVYKGVFMIYPTNMTSFYLSPGEIKSNIDALPGSTGKLVKSIELSPYPCPENDMLRKIYNDPTFTVAADVDYNTGVVTFFEGGNPKIKKLLRADTLAHETGHFLDQNLDYPSRGSEYAKAFTLDKTNSKSITDGYASKYAEDFGEMVGGTRKYEEDYAEVFAAIVSGEDTPAIANRAKLIKKGIPA